MFGFNANPRRFRRVTVWASLIALGVVGCDSPKPPSACGSLPQVTIHTGETTVVSACFNDPNGDLLTYSATSSNPAVATATAAGATVTVRAVSPGDASIIVTASDPDGLQGQQSFQVMVPNRPPIPVGSMPSVEVSVGETQSVSVSQYFSEPDGQALTYSATSSNPAVATVSVAGSTVTVAAIAKGVTNVTVTATDPGGLIATQTLEATVPNRAPQTVGVIADQTVHVGDTATLDVAAHFTDPDRDMLTYRASSSHPSVATVSVSGSTVTIAALATGTATITVAASDPAGLTATQTLEATVPNRAPEPVGTIPDRTVEVGEAVTLDLSPYFEDPDGDPLSYTVASSNPGVASGSVQGSSLTIAAVAAGRATLTVTARDQGGASATQRIRVTVPNRSPRRVGTIPAQTLAPGGTATIDASRYFTDPDGDALTYSARTSNSAVATASVSGSTVTITAVANGVATITVTSRDPGGLTAQQQASVTVSSDFTPLSGLTITASGAIRIGNFTNAGCLRGNLTLNGVRYDIHWTEWQRRTGSSAWTQVAGTRKTGEMCGYNLTNAQAGEYRFVGELTVNGVRGRYRWGGPTSLDSPRAKLRWIPAGFESPRGPSLCVT